MNRIRRLIRWFKSPSKSQQLATYRENRYRILHKLKLELEYGKAAYNTGAHAGEKPAYWKGYCQAMHELLDYVKEL